MTNFIYSEDKLNVSRIANMELPMFEKSVDRRGYLYIVEDSAYEGFLKIGRTTDLKKRLMAYNSDRPYNSVRYIAVSVAFEDVMVAESMVLEKLYEAIEPTTFKREWFEAKHKDVLIKWIGIAEKERKHLDVPDCK